MRLGPITLALMALVAPVGLCPGMAAAQEAKDRAMAESLFRAGRVLMEKGKYAEACPKIAESQRIDPHIGTLLNLALCHEGEGMTASAWAEYLQVAEQSKRAGQADRQRIARQRADALEPSLAKVIIDAPAPGVEVTLDGEAIQAGAFGTPFWADPGEHVVQATASGKVPYTEKFTLAAAGEHEVKLPPLEAEKPPAPPPPVAPPPAAPAEDANQEAVARRRLLGYVIGGGGVVLVAVGAYLGVHAFSEKSTAEAECDAQYCTQVGLDAISQMKTSEAVSTVTIGSGLVALGVGAYLVLFGHSGDVRASGGARGGLVVAPTVGPQARGVALQGAW